MGDIGKRRRAGHGQDHADSHGEGHDATLHDGFHWHEEVFTAPEDAIPTSSSPDPGLPQVGQ